MPNTEKHAALAEFAEFGDEGGFAEIVREFSGLVFTSALRRTGDRELAEEVAQNVFAIVARKARRLATHPSLAAWFYTTVKLEAAKALRSRQRHQRRVEALAEEMKTYAASMTADEQQNWRDALPLLDESLDRLGEADRQIVLGRFFEERSFKQIAERSGSSEAACKMRLKRALAKLNGWLTGRGVTLSATALATGMTAEFSKAAPVAVAASLPSKAIAASSSIGASTILTNTLSTMSSAKINTIAVGVVLLIAAIPFAVQQAEINGLDRQRENQGRAVSPRTELAPPREVISGNASVKQILARIRNPMTVDEIVSKWAAFDLTRDFAVRYGIELHLKSLSATAREELAEGLRSHPSLEAVGLALEVARTPGADPITSAKLDRMLEEVDFLANLGGPLIQWARQDPEAAIAWFESRRDTGKLAGRGASGNNKDSVKSLEISLFCGLVDISVERATEFISGATKDQRRAAYQSGGRRLVGREDAGRDQVIKWMRSLDSPDERAAVASGAVAEIASSHDLESAAKFLLSADLNTAGMVNGLLEALDSGKNRSIPWLEKVKFTTAHIDEAAYAELYKDLVYGGQFWEDEGLPEWLDSLPKGNLRDVALAASSMALADDGDGEMAIEQAERIEDSASRSESIQYALNELADWDREAAEVLAEEHGYELKTKSGKSKE